MWQGPAVPLRSMQGPGTSSELRVIVGVSPRLPSPGPAQLSPSCPSGCAAWCNWNAKQHLPTILSHSV